MELEGRIQCKC